MLGDEFDRKNEGLIKLRPKYQYEKDQEELNNSITKKIIKYITIGALIVGVGYAVKTFASDDNLKLRIKSHYSQKLTLDDSNSSTIIVSNSKGLEKLL